MTRCTGKPLVATATEPRQSPQRPGFRRHHTGPDAAEGWLRQALAAGPVPAKAVILAWRQGGGTRAELRAARGRIGATSYRRPQDGPWWWAMPRPLALPPVIPPGLTALADPLAGVAPQDRQGIVAHVQALVRLSPARRQAIMTLTRPVE